MPRALCLLREGLVYRKAAFCAGLEAAGYALAGALPAPRRDDVLCIWNRYGGFADQARRFEASGARVLVAENAYVDPPGERWFSLALSHHGGAGTWHYGGPERWDALGLDLKPWRQSSGEFVIMGQRGIGEPGIASPPGWAEATRKRIGGRIRPHPGKAAPAVPLEQDLETAASVVTWASSAALRALMLGVPVWYEMTGWIGAGASLPVSQFGGAQRRDDGARLDMFRRLAWAQWRLSEIASGAAFRNLLA